MAIFLFWMIVLLVATVYIIYRTTYLDFTPFGEIRAAKIKEIGGDRKSGREYVMVCLWTVFYMYPAGRKMAFKKLMNRTAVFQHDALSDITAKSKVISLRAVKGFPKSPDVSKLAEKRLGTPKPIEVKGPQNMELMAYFRLPKWKMDSYDRAVITTTLPIEDSEYDLVQIKVRMRAMRKQFDAWVLDTETSEVNFIDKESLMLLEKKYI